MARAPSLSSVFQQLGLAAQLRQQREQLEAYEEAQKRATRNNNLANVGAIAGTAIGFAAGGPPGAMLGASVGRVAYPLSQGGDTPDSGELLNTGLQAMSYYDASKQRETAQAEQAAARRENATLNQMLLENERAGLGEATPGQYEDFGGGGTVARPGALSSLLQSGGDLSRTSPGTLAAVLQSMRKTSGDQIITKTIDGNEYVGVKGGDGSIKNFRQVRKGAEGGDPKLVGFQANATPGELTVEGEAGPDVQAEIEFIPQAEALARQQKREGRIVYGAPPAMTADTALTFKDLTEAEITSAKLPPGAYQKDSRGKLYSVVDGKPLQMFEANGERYAFDPTAGTAKPIVGAVKEGDRTSEQSTARNVVLQQMADPKATPGEISNTFTAQSDTLHPDDRKELMTALLKDSAGARESVRSLLNDKELLKEKAAVEKAKAATDKWSTLSDADAKKELGLGEKESLPKGLKLQRHEDGAVRILDVSGDKASKESKSDLVANIYRDWIDGVQLSESQVAILAYEAYAGNLVMNALTGKPGEVPIPAMLQKRYTEKNPAVLPKDPAQVERFLSGLKTGDWILAPDGTKRQKP